MNEKPIKVEYISNIYNYTNVILLIILFIGSFLRIYNLNFKGLWRDELLEVTAAQSRTITGVLSSMSTHFSPPLDYIIVHFFLLFGNNDFFARLPSAIFGILSIVIIYYVAKSLFGTKEGLISALLLSISPYHIWYSQEARMYSLFMLLSMLSILFFYRAIVEDNKKMWYGFIISTTLNIYTHYFAFFMILIYSIFLCILIFKARFGANVQNMVIKVHKKTLLHFAYSIIVIFLFFIPQLQSLISQIVLSGGVLGFGLPPSIQFFGIIFFKMGGWSILSLLLYIGFFVYGLLQILKIAHRNQIILLILWLTTPLFVMFIYTYIKGPLVSDRYFIFILSAFIIIISKGVVSLSYSIDHWRQKYDHYKLNNHMLIIVFTSLLLGVTFTGATIDNLYNYQNKGDKDSGLYLTEHTENNDLIVYLGGDNESDIRYYYSGHAKIINIPNNATSVSNLLNDTSVKEYNRVWIVNSEIVEGMYRGFNDEISIWLDNNCEIQRNGYISNRFRLSQIDQEIIGLFNVEFHEEFKSATLYTCDPGN